MKKHYFIFDASSVWSKSLLLADERKIADLMNDGETFHEVSEADLSALRSALGDDLEVAGNVMLLDGNLVARPSKYHTYDSPSNSLIDADDSAKNADVLLYIRDHRNLLLSQSDWTQLSDNGLTDAQKEQWRTYRQSLRDLPQTYSSATSKSEITWPTKP